MRRRQAMSLTEVVVAVAIFAVGVAALMNLSTGETRAVRLSEERFLAELALAELQEAFGRRTLTWYDARNIPPRPADGAPDTFTDIHRFLLEDHAAILAAQPVPAEPPLSQAATLLREQMAARGIQRSFYFDPFTTPGGLSAGLVTFRVRYTQAGSGEPRILEANEVTYAY